MRTNSIMRNESGAIALITTVIISLMLLLITTSFITIVISGSRQSSDSESSIRAYYQAESGVEDAIGKLKLDRTYQQPNCATNIAPSSSNGWSCQIINNSQNVLKGKLEKSDDAKQIDLAGSPQFNSVNLEWDTSAAHTNFASNLPAASGFASDRPAVMELTIIKYPRNGAVSNADLQIRNILIVPSASGGTIDASAPITSPAYNPARALCDPGATYKCRITLDNLTGSYAYMFRLRARYTVADYQMTFYSGNNLNGGVVQVSDGTATIDVTGRTGNVYRRVVYKVPYNKGVAPGLDYVVFSDANVCKDLSVLNGAITQNCSP